MGRGSGEKTEVSSPSEDMERAVAPMPGIFTFRGRGKGCGPHAEVFSPSEDMERAVAPMAHMDGTWPPFPGDQPLSFLRQTAFPARPSARTMSAPTAGLGAANAPCASPTRPVSPAAMAEPGPRVGDWDHYQ